MRLLLIVVVRPLLWLIAWLPLPVVHILGAGLGHLVATLSRGTSRVMSENIHASGLARDESAVRRLKRRAAAESGKAMLETFAVWLRGDATVLSWVRQVSGWQDVEAAVKAGKGIIFLTPHLGCYEITAMYYASRYPLTILYRPPRQRWILPMMEAGRTRGQAKLAPANAQGVRDLLVAVKKGEAIGILPDQIPSRGEGVWAPFFGRPAYTMTLASKLASKSGATVMLAFGERLPRGRGYHVHFSPVESGRINDVAGLNALIESLVRQCPEQYLWGYDRHKNTTGRPIQPN